MRVCVCVRGRGSGAWEGEAEGGGGREGREGGEKRTGQAEQTEKVHEFYTIICNSSICKFSLALMSHNEKSAKNYEDSFS